MLTQIEIKTMLLHCQSSPLEAKILPDLQSKVSRRQHHAIPWENDGAPTLIEVVTEDWGGYGLCVKCKVLDMKDGD